MGSISVLHQAVTGHDLRWQVVSLCERAAAVVLLTLALPAMLAIALLVRAYSGRTPLIAHRRVGWQGTTLWMLKLRTMWSGSILEEGARGAGGWIERIEDDRGPALKSALMGARNAAGKGAGKGAGNRAGKGTNDPRVPGRFARFLRRHSIDELPQLWHVISGQMSLVGPRPMTERELRVHYRWHADEVLRLKPGLAGLWQVSGRNRLSYAERCRLDLKLVRQRSLAMYFGILLRTFPEVFSGENTR